MRKYLKFQAHDEKTSSTLYYMYTVSMVCHIIPDFGFLKVTKININNYLMIIIYAFFLNQNSVILSELYMD